MVKLILKRTNRIRESKDLTILTEPDTPARFAKKHSRDMGQYGLYSHAGPGDRSAGERMQYISSNCGGAASENIHTAPLSRNVRIYGGSEIVNVYSESELAKYSVEGWMNSDGHRENMLDSRWSRTGVGVYVADDSVFITIVFC